MSGDAVEEFRVRFSEAIAGGAREFVIDMAGVSKIDSSAMGVLVRCQASLRALGGAMVIAGANETVRMALKLTRLETSFEFYANEASALAALRAPR